MNDEIVYGIPQEISDLVSKEIIPQAIDIKFMSNQCAKISAVGILIGDKTRTKIFRNYTLSLKKGKK